MPNGLPWPLVLAAGALLLVASAPNAQPTRAVREIAVAVDSLTVGMGRSVSVHARTSDQNGKPVSGVLLYPLVNRKRWGAHELTDAAGQAVFQLPLPRPGGARIEVAALTGSGERPVRLAPTG